MNVPVKPKLIDALALRYSMEPAAFYAVIKSTVMPGGTTEQIAAFLMVAYEYNLSPILKQIHAFPSKGGGIVPIISIDGWCQLVNTQPQYDGCEFDDHVDEDGKIYAITCRMWRKDRSRATPVTEYLSENLRNTDAWRTSPNRMLRHRAFIQAARLTFGLSAAFDEGHHLETPVEVDMEPIRRQVAPPRLKPLSPAKQPDDKGDQQQGGKAKAKAEEEGKQEIHDPETGELFEPEEYLSDLDGSLVTAQNEKDLTAIWTDFEVQQTLGAHPTYFERAKDLLAWHQKRLLTKGS